VYRVSEGKENMHRNEDTNAEALKVLRAGGAVLIFAEGKSALEKILKPLKKGPFRLAAMAAANDVAPVIAPVGINYVTPARADGDVFILAGKGIDTRLLFAEAERNEVRLATSSMRETDQSLRGVVWDARDANIARYADDALQIMQQEHDTFSFEDAVVLIAKLNAADDQMIATFSTKNGLRDYLGFKEHDAPDEPISIAEWVETIVLAPFAMAGLAFHFLPVRLAKMIADKKVREMDFYAPVFVGLAVVLIFLWYVLAAVLFLIFWKAGLLLLLLLMTCGVLYRRYWTNLSEE